jgi:basic membrane protein A
VDVAIDANNAKLVTPAMQKAVDAARADIISGKIKVIDYMTNSSCK